MIVLPKEIKKDITALKRRIAKNNKAEDKEFRKICEWLKIDPDSAEGETVWDHIYNDTDWTVRYD